MSRCMCGADDCPSCHPEAFARIGGRLVYAGDECEVCGGKGVVPCGDCEYADDRSADGDCERRDGGECPACPRCHGLTAWDRAEAAYDDECDRRMDARRDREWEA